MCDIIPKIDKIRGIEKKLLKIFYKFIYAQYILHFFYFQYFIFKKYMFNTLHI